MQTHPLTVLMDDPDAERLVRDTASRLPGFRPAGDDAPSGLVVMDLGPDPEAGLARVERTLAHQAVTGVILAGAPDPQALMRAMRAGVRDFLPLPLKAEDVEDALRRFLEHGPEGRDGAESVPGGRPDGAGRLVYVLGGKGGVGATTVAVNTAVQYALDMADAEGRDAAPGNAAPGNAALVDLRSPLGEVPLFLDLEHDYTWAEAVRDPSRLDATFVDSLMTRHESGLRVLAAPNQFLESASLTVEAAEPLFDLLRRRNAVTVVDGSDALDEATMRVMGMADDILLVIVLSLPCLANAKKLLDTFDALDAFDESAVRLVVNRHLSKAEISVEDAEELLGRKVHATLPNDYETTLAAINQGAPLAWTAPRAPVTTALAGLARSLSGDAGRRTRAGRGLFSRLLPRRRPAGPLHGLRAQEAS